MSAHQLVNERKLDSAEMDMTPMVNVTFLLLIFFMVTAAFSLQKSIQIPNPQNPSEQVRKQDQDELADTVTVLVDSHNTFRVMSPDWEAEAPSEQELLVQLRAARKGDSAGNVPTKLVVRAHIDCYHEKVVMALDAGTEVGMEEVQLMTIEEDE